MLQRNGNTKFAVLAPQKDLRVLYGSNLVSPLLVITSSSEMTILSWRDRREGIESRRGRSQMLACRQRDTAHA